MMDRYGHTSIDTLRGYVRDAELFKHHAGAGLLWASATETRAPRATRVEPMWTQGRQGWVRGRFWESVKTIRPPPPI